MRRRARTAVGLFAATVIAALPACGGGSGGKDSRAATPGPPGTTVPATLPSTVPPVATTLPPVPTTTPTFAAAVAPVTTADLGASWHDGCPVGPDQLRRVTLSYWDFDGRPQTGALVVNVDAVDAIRAAFQKLFEQRFPIRRMDPIDKFTGSDDASMAADNTSAFNCRLAVAAGPPQWSVHSFGRAIDVNPVENPYVLGTDVLPPAGSAYVDRTTVRPGMAVTGGPLVEAFAAVGWPWSGRWSGSPDYQHFSANGS